MDLTRTRLSKLIRIIAAALGIAVVAAYAGYRSLPYVRGPVIHVFQPVNGSAIASTTVTVIGRADRVNSLSLDDDPIQVDQAGNFKQTLIVFPGVNVITLKATDQFRRSTTFELDILGLDELPTGRSGTGTIGTSTR